MMRSSLKTVAAVAAAVALAAVPARAQEDFRIVWHELPDCAPQVETIVVGPQDLCHRVPNSVTAGYRVTCNPGGVGGGTFSVCADAQCGSCDVNTPFEEDQCLPNPPEFGSASVTISCRVSVGATAIAALAFSVRTFADYARLRPRSRSLSLCRAPCPRRPPYPRRTGRSSPGTRAMPA
jgi:hypothetical protein